MPNKTYLITGANRGLGRGLFNHYVAQPNNTLIAAVRNTSTAASLLDIPRGHGTKVVLVQIDSASKTDAFNTVTELRAQGISHIDVVISCAGIMPTMHMLSEQPLDELEEVLQINALSVLLLYQATLPLLKNAPAPKFVFISGKGGSLEAQTSGRGMGKARIGAHAAAKALGNMLVVRMGVESEWLGCFCVNPGLVQTDMGNAGAKAAGLEKAPLTLEESSRNTAEIIDNATNKEHSGKFFDETIDRIHPW